MTPELLAAFGQFGPLGLMIAYLIWREKIGAEKRGEIEKERAESDKALASALAALTVTIQHLDGRFKWNSQADQIEVIRSVRIAAHDLEAACTRVIGGGAMAMSKPTIETIADRLPPEIEALMRRLNKEE